jgi:putative PIN family toxin of toxin-antitoxin system
MAGAFRLVISDPVFDEVARNMVKPYFRRQLTPRQIAANLTLLANEAQLTPITAAISGIATHPEDDAILATAVSAGADYLVTGDTKLQQLGSYQGVRVLSPAAFAQHVLIVP